MAILKCKMCGGELTLLEDISTATCEYCGIMQTVPKADNEKKLNLFVRANRLRAACDFDKAAGIYEAIIADFPEEAEAYWGLVLCKYGIEYVDDPATGKKIPTCHRSGFDSVMKDTNVELAQEYSDIMARRLYREEAKQIEELRKNIVAVSANEEPYDIFICYKETDFDGKRTLDSVLAQDIYDALTDKGYRAFFSRISLEDKLGAEYEPYIFAALNSAKIMLVIGTDYEYFNAVWVKNEWSRFLKLMAQDKSKHLIPCYKGIDAYDMPEEFARLQAQDLGKVGAIQDLLRGIEKIIPRQTAPKETFALQSAPDGNPTVESCLERAFIFLEDEDWDSANAYCEKVLDIDPKIAKAYLGKLLAELELSHQEHLLAEAESFEYNKNYQKAIRYADVALRNTLEGYLAAVKDTIERREKERIARLEREEKARLEQLRIAQEREAMRSKEAEQRLIPLRNQLKVLEGIIAAGDYHTVGLRSDGSVVAVGKNTYGQCDVDDLYDVISVNAAGAITVCLKSNGTVVARGDNRYGQCDVQTWTDITALAVRSSYVAGLKHNGTVVATGANRAGQCNVSHWRNIVAICAGSTHLVGLRKDGTVVATGNNEYGQCDVSAWENITDIAATYDATVGLCSDGTVVYAGKLHLPHSQDWKNLVKIISDDFSVIGLRADGTAVGDCYSWENALSISASYGAVAVKEDGMVLTNKRALQKFSQNEASKVKKWKDIGVLALGFNFLVGLKKDGTVVAAGTNEDGQCDVSQWKLFHSFKNLEEERKEAAASLRAERTEALMIAMKAKRRAAGLCQHCGGKLKGLFSKTCVACGMPKNY